MWWNHFILFKSVSFIINFNLYICQKHCVYNVNIPFYVNSSLTPNRRFIFCWGVVKHSFQARRNDFARVCVGCGGGVGNSRSWALTAYYLKTTKTKQFPAHALVGLSYISNFRSISTVTTVAVTTMMMLVIVVVVTKILLLLPLPLLLLLLLGLLLLILLSLLLLLLLLI